MNKFYKTVVLCAAILVIGGLFYLSTNSKTGTPKEIYCTHQGATSIPLPSLTIGFTAELPELTSSDIRATSDSDGCENLGVLITIPGFNQWSITVFKSVSENTDLDIYKDTDGYEEIGRLTIDDSKAIQYKRSGEGGLSSVNTLFYRDGFQYLITIAQSNYAIPELGNVYNQFISTIRFYE